MVSDDCTADIQIKVSWGWPPSSHILMRKSLKVIWRSQEHEKTE